MANRGSSLACDQCNKEHKEKRRLVAHINNIHGIGTAGFTCDHCSKEANLKINLATHIRLQHQKFNAVVFQCQQCDYGFTSKSGLNLHDAVIHQGIRFTCDICGKQSGSRSHLLTHITSMHQPKKRPFECNVCGCTFTQRCHLKTHSETKHYKKTVHDDDCSAKLGTKLALIRHVNSIHLKLCLYACADCEATFSDQTCLSEHVKWRHKKIVFTCDVCDESFRERHKVIDHCFVVHMQLYELICSLCDRVFRKRGSLFKHNKKIHG